MDVISQRLMVQASTTCSYLGSTNTIWKILLTDDTSSSSSSNSTCPSPLPFHHGGTRSPWPCRPLGRPWPSTSSAVCTSAYTSSSLSPPSTSTPRPPPSSRAPSSPTSSPPVLLLLLLLCLSLPCLPFALPLPLHRRAAPRSSGPSARRPLHRRPCPRLRLHRQRWRRHLFKGTLGLQEAELIAIPEHKGRGRASRACTHRACSKRKMGFRPFT